MSPNPPTKRKRKQTSRQNDYIGKAGQLAVMAEFALLGYNVSLPEIDKGDDIFVVNDNTHELWRIQVKGATPLASRNGNYMVIVKEDQIKTKPKSGSPDLYFIFALRKEYETKHEFSNIAAWRFVVMKREQLLAYINDQESKGGKFGSLNVKQGRRYLSISFNVKTGKAQCSRVPWEVHMENWSAVWPRLDHDNLAPTDTIDTQIIIETREESIGSGISLNSVQLSA